MLISINGSQVSILLFCLAFLSCNIHGGENHDYRDALSKSILYFQAQRSGKLPPLGDGQDVEWRGDSGLSDGLNAGVDLTGGYYDAGDNVKFNFPMAFTTTMLSWGAIEYGKRLGDVELENTRADIRWATDYLLKCALTTPGKLYVQVGNPIKDHSCWERPEDMDTDRSAYSVTIGSDVAGETAAALAAASIVFRKVDWVYSRKLLQTAKGVMDFALANEGSYIDQLEGNVCPFYCSYSGYKDELLWGAAWLLRATHNEDKYLNLINSLGDNVNIDVFGWDNKYAGALVLLSRRFLVGNESMFQQYSQEAENFMCKILPNSPYSSTLYTPGGLMYKIEGGNLQYVTAISFLMTSFAKYMAFSKHTFKCGDLVVTTKDLRSLVKKQVDYILGDNPEGMSYMVGFGNKFPKNVHHRGASMPSIKTHPQKISCMDGFSQYMHTSNNNANELTGAIVGGPNPIDDYDDDRNNPGQSEACTYYTAPLVGTLAYLAAAHHAK